MQDAEFNEPATNMQYSAYAMVVLSREKMLAAADDDAAYCEA